MQTGNVMKIILATYGSRGDVQPMLALSLALKQAGQDVLLVGPPEKAGWAGLLGCPYRPIGRDATAFIDSLKDAHSIRSALCFAGFLRKELRLQFDVLPGIIEGVDLVIGSSLMFCLSTVAESMNIAYRYIAFTPQLLPSAYHPMLMFKRQWLPIWMNRITWKMIRKLDRFNLVQLLNSARRQRGLRPIRDSWDHILGQNTIVASDRAIAEIPPDGPPAAVQTGYMHLGQPDQTLPELDAFLNAGPPPVYAGFGSMPKEDQARNVPLIVKAVRSLGGRVIIGKFWDGPSGLSDNKDVFFIQGHPHLRLFPRMAAVVHHGGAGTTASSAISGVPQVVVPHIFDQYYWGHRVYQSNLGPRPIWRSGLTAQRLASAIEECLSSGKIRQGAERAAEKIKRQNGLEITVNEILKTPIARLSCRAERGI